MPKKIIPSDIPSQTFQDWDNVTWDKYNRDGSTKQKDVSDASRYGNVNIATKKNSSIDWKIENSSENLGYNRTTLEFRKVLQEARLYNKLTQNDLAKHINEKSDIIKNYENGTAIPNQRIIQKLNKLLGIRLPKIPPKKTE